MKKYIEFIKDDIWRIRSKELSKLKSLLVRNTRILLLTWRGFNEDMCQLRASALTFFSLLSIVPAAAMIFGIAKGFKFEKDLEEKLLGEFPAQQEVIGHIIEYANNMLNNTKGGVLALVGILVILWTVIQVLSNIEHSFNDIWMIKDGRKFIRKLGDYLLFMLICTFLFLLASSANVFISTQLTTLIANNDSLGVLGPFINVVVHILPYFAIWLLFSFIYIFMPNIKVKLKSAIFAGIIAGTAFQLWQLLYIICQIGVAKANAIYGSFAALPLFLAWLQVSWLIVLFGAELSFAHQNESTYEFEPDSLRLTDALKSLLTLRIVLLIVKRFCHQQLPLNDDEISNKLELPIRLVRQILFDLEKATIVSKITNSQDESIKYCPARPVDTLTINCVFEALRNVGSNEFPIDDNSAEFKTLSSRLKTLKSEMQASSANILLKDIKNG